MIIEDFKTISMYLFSSGCVSNLHSIQDADDKSDHAYNADDSVDEDLVLNRSGPQYQNLNGEHTVGPLGGHKNVSHEHTNFLMMMILNNHE